MTECEIIYKNQGIEAHFSKPINILLIEENLDVARIVIKMLVTQNNLESSPDYVIQQVNNLEKAISALSERSFDVILIALSLQDNQSLDIVTGVLEAALITPVIVVNESDSQLLNLQILQAGAQDYLVKGHFDEFTLPLAIHKAIVRKSLWNALAESENRYQALSELSPVGIFRTDLKGKTTYVNSRFCEISGLSVSQALGDGWISAVYPEDQDGLMREWRQTIRKQESLVKEYRFLREDGTLVWVISHAIPDRNAYGNVVGYVCSITDISELKQVEEALSSEQSLLRTLIDNLPSVIYVKDDTCHKIISNANDLHIMGVSSEAEVIGKTDFDFYPEDIAANFYADDKYVIQSGKSIINREEKFNLPDNSIGWLLTSKIPLFDSTGKVSGLVGIGHDITKRRLAEQSLQRQTEELTETNARLNAEIERRKKLELELIKLSTRDSLTGLYNRYFFIEEMERLERGRGFPISIIMADVDRLKETNDSLGHIAGDKLLQNVAKILLTAFRAEDIVARIGGDEFAILLPNTSSEAVEIALKRVKGIINEYNSLHTGENPISVSFGFNTTETKISLSDVLKIADQNMYRDKKRRKI